MEKKLAEYRTRKQRTELLDKTKERVKSLFTFKPKKKECNDLDNNIEEQENLIESEYEDDVEIVDDEVNEETCCSYVDLIYYTLLFILWAVIWLIFINLQFGAVYFIFSAFIFIYFNTRTRKKRRHEVSAYSVFNKNCESIDGTLKAEQLERQMIYGRLT